jgi:hypothetical protein
MRQSIAERLGAGRMGMMRVGTYSLRMLDTQVGIYLWHASYVL